MESKLWNVESHYYSIWMVEARFGKIRWDDILYVKISYSINIRILAWWMLHLIEDDWSLSLVQVVPPKGKDAIVIPSTEWSHVFLKKYSALAEAPIIPCQPNFVNMINLCAPFNHLLMFENHLRTKGCSQKSISFSWIFHIWDYDQPITGKLPNLICGSSEKGTAHG